MITHNSNFNNQTGLKSCLQFDGQRLPFFFINFSQILSSILIHEETSKLEGKKSLSKRMSADNPVTNVIVDAIEWKVDKFYKTHRN